MFQNDGTRDGREFLLHGSFNGKAMNGNRMDKDDLLDFVSEESKHQEVVSSSSFLSKSSSKYSLDQYEPEAADKEIKSQFDSSSGGSDSDSPTEAAQDGNPAQEEGGLAGKLNFLRRQTLAFIKQDAEGTTRRRTEGQAKSKATDKPELKRSATTGAENKSAKNSEGGHHKQGWILKKATSTYLGMANWQRRYI